MRTAIEACAAKTEPCVYNIENTNLFIDNHVQSILKPLRFRIRLVEANKTEPTAVNFWRHKCEIRVKKKALDISKHMHTWNQTAFTSMEDTP